MAERLVIEFTPKGARLVQGQIGGIASTSKKANTSVSALKATLATLGVGLALRAVVNTLRSFSQEISTVRAITGATAEQFRALSDRARELGATTRFSASDAAEGMTNLARAGFTAAESIETIDDTLRLAQVGALGLGDAAGIAAAALRGFRLETDQASRVVDVLALAANSANTTVFELGDALKFVAPVAASVGVEIEETAALINTLSDAGLKGTLAGTGLRQIIKGLVAPTSQAKKIIRDLGLEMKDVDPQVVGLTTAIETLAGAGVGVSEAFGLFAARGGPAFEVLAAGTPKIRQMTGELQEAEGTAERVAKIMDDNLNGALFAVRSAAESVILAFGELGGDANLVTFFRGLAEALRAVARNLEQLGQGLVAGGTIMLAYAAQTKLAALGVTSFGDALIFARIKMLDLNKVISANKIVILITALAVVVAALVAFRDEIKLGGDRAATLGDAFTVIFGGIQKLITAVTNNFKRGLLAIDEIFGSTFGRMFESVNSFVLEVALAVDRIVGFFRGAAFAIGAAAKGWFNLAKKVLQGEAGPLGEEVGLIGVQMGNAFERGLATSGVSEFILQLQADIDAAAAARNRLEEDSKKAGSQTLPLTIPLQGAAGAPRAKAGGGADPIGDILKGLSEENRLLKLGNEEREIQVELNAILNELRQAGLEGLLPMDLIAIENQVRLNAELRNQVDAVNALDEAIAQLEQRVGSVGKVMNELLLGSIKEFSSSLIDTIGSGGSISDFFDDLGQSIGNLAGQIAQLIIQLLIAKAIKAALGGTGIGSFFGLAQGGFAEKNQPKIVGERGPELFVPQTSGRVEPNINVNAQAAPAQVVIVQDEQDIQEMLLTKQGQAGVLQVIRLNPKRAGTR